MPFGVLALTPPALLDPSIAVAACRAGAVGVLDLEHARDTGAATRALATLTRLSRAPSGIRLGADDPSLSRAVLRALPGEVRTVIAAPSAVGELSTELRALRGRGVQVLAEVTDAAQLADDLPVDGLVARGMEAGAWVGDETTFILLQRLLERSCLPIWAHGGIGLHTAAACRASGAAGIVLDSQLALLRESALPDQAKTAVARMDGSETVCLGGELGAPFRAYTRPGLAALDELRQLAARLAGDSRPLSRRASEWRAAIRARVGWGDGQLWPLGQDAAFAGDLARRFVTVGGVVAGLADTARSHVRTAARLRPLAEHSSLAQSHGTRYPILQGPMTRVSDTAAFAQSVAEAGALPFLALALLRGPEVRTLLTETSRLLGPRPWGVGILGFVPIELRQEQLEVIRDVRPPFALIAGGRPDQALALEEVGIPTYLHVPSPALLRLFIDGGARRFVFEGRECGGHVGPRSSFVLWNSMIDVLLDCVPPGEAAAACHVVFAGGVHDAASAAMVAAMAAPLAERGIRIGVLLGTAYLFTEEAVRDGAIAPAFQAEAVRCSRTALLETAPGHATRCLTTPFVETFERERRRLEAAGRPAEEIRDALEDLNLGRLRIASKGITRNPRAAEPGAARFVALSAEEQRQQGMYMIGQVVALRDRVCAIADLHREVAVGGTERLGAPEPEPAEPAAATRPCDIAIIGMACVMPKAPSLEAYWSNIVNKVDAIIEVPPDRFDWRRYYDPDPLARDKIYSKWGGFIDPVPFDPARYGMPPNSLPSIEPLQLLTLEVVRRGLEDAGYGSRAFARARTGVIVGVGGGVAELGQRYAFRANLPTHVPDAPPGLLEALPEWTEDSFAGIILNVAAGRVANRLDLGGVNYTVDAACASSLAAIYAGVRELEAGTADTMIVAGADTVQSPFGYLCFAKTRALSPHGRCRTFDESADGIVISEGIGAVVLKRLADAERDGDRIYAVIKAVAGSSDGRDRSLTAPRPEGQMLALRRAYATAGVSPATVELVEAHGTGTVAGDQAEIEALTRVFGEASDARQWCAVGSVKSMIGHAKCAAGLAGLIKVSKALHHKVLPPTLGVERPNSKARFDEGPFYVNSEARPWVRLADEPRRAGVSSFGFGGTNFHVVVEEYTGVLPAAAVPATLHEWPAELFLLSGRTRADLAAAVQALIGDLRAAALPPLRRLAASAWARARAARAGLDGTALTIAVVATSVDDLRAKMAVVETRLAEGAGAIEDPRGIHFTESPLAREGSIAFLFPGQGSQYPDMLRDLASSFGDVRECFETASRQLAGRFPRPLASYVFPPPRFTPEAERACEEALKQTNVAQPSLGAAGLGMFRLLLSLGVRADAVAGHSYGEYVALCAAGSLSEAALYELSEARGRAIIDNAGPTLGTMAAVQGGSDAVRDALDGIADVWIANINGPRQVVVSGTGPGIDTAVERLAAAGLAARPVAVGCAFHSPLIAEAGRCFAERLARVEFAPPSLPVFSNTDAAPYADDPATIARSLAAHLTQPVRFMDEVEAMYAAGCRLFVEVGPRNILTSLVQQTLEGRPALAVATDSPGRPGLVQLLHALGQLAAHGVAVSLDPLFAGRLEDAEAPPAPSPTTWLVSGGAARPASGKRGTGAGPVPLAKAAAAPGAPLPRGAAAPAAGGPPSPPAPPSVDTGAVAPPSPVAMAAGAGGDAEDTASEVMVQFQRTMAKFLETQRNVMLAYLGAGGAAAAPGDEPAASLAAAAPAPAGRADDAEGQAAPAPVPAAPMPAAASPAAAVDRAWLERELLRVASERTGYPVEMLALDASMEADLGIDSIKRVEILGGLRQALPAAMGAQVQGALETLTRAKTLGAIVEAVSGLLAERSGARPGVIPAPIVAASAAIPAPAPADEEAVPRFVLRAVDCPIPAKAPAPHPAGVILITEDALGIAGRTAAALRGAGARVVVLGAGEALTPEGPGAYRLRLDDAGQVARLIEQVQASGGPVGGLLHLAPLGRPVDRPELAEWRERLRREVKGLFHLARGIAEDVRRTPGGFVLGVTALDGALGCRGLGADAFAGSAGVAGLVKTLGVEWPGTRCRVVDVDPADPPELIGDHILAELGADDGEPEVGWAGQRRTVPRVQPAALDEQGAQAPLDAESVVLVTGGARGITGEVAEELARRYRPILVLVGQSPLPDAEEPKATVGIESPPELRAALIAELGRGGHRPGPAEVERACRAVLRDREMRRRIAAMRAAGATVGYRQADVRDERAFGDVIRGVYASHGRIDGVIHGAGVIEDKLVSDKTPESFDRVFDTKADSAFILARTLRPEGLRFLAFFSSVAGRFANRGQADYVAANEVMNKLAQQLDRAWPGRVVALNWGPWGGSGMLTGGVARQFADRGVRVIAPAPGRQSFVREIESGRKGEAEVVLGGGPWERVEARPPAAELEFPLLNGAPVRVTAQGAAHVVRTLDVEEDLYLDDHRLEGRAVLPAAMAMELIAELAQKAWPDLKLVGFKSFNVLRGVVLDDRATVRLVASPQTGQAGAASLLQVDVEMFEEGRSRPSYRGAVELARHVPDQPTVSLPERSRLRPFPLSTDRAYDEWLFHGPRLQCITEIEGMSEQGIVARLRPSDPAACLRHPGGAQWLMDPVILDGALQLALLWGRATWDVSALPSRFQAFRLLAPLDTPALRCHVRMRPETSEQAMRPDIVFTTLDGRILAVWEDLLLTCHRPLNRLMGRSGADKKTQR